MKLKMTFQKTIDFKIDDEEGAKNAAKEFAENVYPELDFIDASPDYEIYSKIFELKKTSEELIKAINKLKK